MNRDTAVLMIMGFGYGAFVSWLLFSEPITISPEVAKESAAWVQAIGSILAIGLAMYVPWRQRRYQIKDHLEQRKRESDREEELIRLMHTALFQPVEAYRAHCVFVQAHLGEPLLVRAAMAPDLFERPPEFDQFREKLHLMGSVGLLINFLIAHQDAVRVMYGDFRRLKNPFPAPFIDSFSTRLEAAVEKAEEIKVPLRAVAMKEK